MATGFWIWREESVVLKLIDFVVFRVQEKSGGKIILRQGGVVYLFRGRNYNTKTRPVIPLMLEPICHLGETLEVCVSQEALLYWRFQL
jgi:hypothetical protein